MDWLYNLFNEATSQWNYWTKGPELIEAARQGDIDKINTLIQAGANVNFIKIENSHSETPLSVAIVQGHFETVQLLLEQGADFRSIPTEIGDESALHIAARQNRGTIIKLLIDKGASPISTDSYDRNTPIDTAFQYGNIDAMAQLLEAVPVENKTQVIQSLLKKVVQYKKYENNQSNQIDALKILCNIHHADLHAVDENGLTPLLIAVSKGNFEVFQAILDLDPRTISACDNEGNTALHIATQARNLDMIQVLVTQGGLRPDTVNTKGESSFNIIDLRIDRNGLIISDRQYLLEREEEIQQNIQDMISSSSGENERLKIAEKACQSRLGRYQNRIQRCKEDIQKLETIRETLHSSSLQTPPSASCLDNPDQASCSYHQEPQHVQEEPLYPTLSYLYDYECNENNNVSASNKRPRDENETSSEIPDAKMRRPTCS